MEHEVWYKYPQAVNQLPDDIFFITTSELEAMYPDKTPKERENLITKEHGCVFLMQIGANWQAESRMTAAHRTMMTGN